MSPITQCGPWNLAALLPHPTPTRPRLETGGSSVEKLTHLGEDTSDGDSGILP